MKHISLDSEDDRIKQFVLSLSTNPEGSVLELEGEAVCRVLPAHGSKAIDPEQVKAAILNRRDASRVLNDDWAEADHEVWNQTSDFGD